MNTLSMPQRSVLLITLALLLAATRSHHWLSLTAVPDLSWAVLFLAGFYGAGLGGFVALFLLATLVDVVAIGWGGVGDYCFTPAYAMLVPAYASLWLAGRWYANRHLLALQSVPALLLSIAGGGLLAELFSSGGFYFLSGRFTETSLSEFGQRLLTFFPDNLLGLLLYVGIAALVHTIAALSLGRRPALSLR